MLWIVSVAQLILVSCAFGPSRIEKMGKITLYSFDQFKIMEEQQEKAYNSSLSMPNTKIITLFLKNMAKTAKALQIVRLKASRGLYELILLTQPNNYENKLVIIKQNPEEYAWVNKNLHLNGLENETTLYYTKLSNQNTVTEGRSSSFNQISTIFNVQSQCEQQNCRSYRIESTLQHITKMHKLTEQSGHNNLQLFLTVSTLKQAQILSKSIKQLKQNHRIQIILQLKIEIPLDLFTLTVANSVIYKPKIYSIYLKVDEKKTVLQFKQVSISIKQKYEYQFLSEGVYYLTQTDNFFKK